MELRRSREGFETSLRPLNGNGEQVSEYRSVRFTARSRLKIEMWGPLE